MPSGLVTGLGTLPTRPSSWAHALGGRDLCVCVCVCVVGACVWFRHVGLTVEVEIGGWARGDIFAVGAEYLVSVLCQTTGVAYNFCSLSLFIFFCPLLLFTHSWPPKHIISFLFLLPPDQHLFVWQQQEVHSPNWGRRIATWELGRKECMDDWTKDTPMALYQRIFFLTEPPAKCWAALTSTLLTLVVFFFFPFPSLALSHCSSHAYVRQIALSLSSHLRTYPQVSGMILSSCIVA